MPTSILTYAIKQLRKIENPSFLIIEDVNGAIVDFAESEEEANSKCTFAYSRGIKCTFYESSVKTIDDVREATKKTDLDLKEGDSIIIPNLDLKWSPE